MAKLLQGSTVNDFLIWHDGSTDDRESALIYQVTAQTFTTGALIPVTYDTVLFDKLGGWNQSTGEYVIQKGGIYFVSSAIAWSNTTAGVRTVLEIRKNGTTYAWLNQEHSGATKNFSTEGMIVMECSAGDKLTIYAFHDVGANMATFPISNGVGISPSTYFNIMKFA